MFRRILVLFTIGLLFSVFAVACAKEAGDEGVSVTPTPTPNDVVSIPPGETITPIEVPTPEPTVAPTPEPTVAPTPEPTPTATPSPTPTPTLTPALSSCVVLEEQDCTRGEVLEYQGSYVPARGNKYLVVRATAKAIFAPFDGIVKEIAPLPFVPDAKALVVQKKRTGDSSERIHFLALGNIQALVPSNTEVRKGDKIALTEEDIRVMTGELRPSGPSITCRILITFERYDAQQRRLVTDNDLFRQFFPVH